MARQSMYHQPWRKNLHIFYDFLGGMNTVEADENLEDNEFNELKNVEIGERGSLKRRHGFRTHIPSIGEGKGQGYFRYFKQGGTYEELVAIGGRIYRSDGTTLDIDGLQEFQSERPIEAVQKGRLMYIATGTKLVVYDGEEAKVVEPYKPKPLEALYIGTNALADNPSDFMEHGEAEHLRIDGVTFSSRYGITNEPITLTAFISAPDGVENYEFMFEQRTVEQREGFWEEGQGWSNDNSYTFETDYQGDVQFRVWVRPIGDTEEDFSARQYLVPKYTIKPAPDPNDEDVDNETIHTCNRILLHWDRLILYGDKNNPDAIFISHLNNFNYFPVPNSLIFETREREPITKIIRYRDHLVVFTNNSIQALFGKSPMDYQRVVVHTGIGCVAGNSVQIMENNIVFLSKEGVHIVKSFGYNEIRMNVEKIDLPISNMIPLDENACSSIHENQYHLVFPDRNLRFRCYFKAEYAWVYDESDNIDFQIMYSNRGELYAIRENGEVVVFDESLNTDNGHIFDMVVKSKKIDFGQPYHDKKLKEIQMILGAEDRRASVSTNVYADDSKVVDTNTSYASVDDNDYVVWNYQNTPNMELYAGTTFGDWVLGSSHFGRAGTGVYSLVLRGRCRQTQFEMVHSEDTPLILLGFGYVFKLKNP